MSNGDFVKACTRGELLPDGRPVVLSLLGKKVGDKADVNAPNGSFTVTVKEIK